MPEENTKLSEKDHYKYKAKQADHSSDRTKDIAQEFTLPNRSIRVGIMIRRRRISR
jgi:hypothetical protein